MPYSVACRFAGSAWYVTGHAACTLCSKGPIKQRSATGSPCKWMQMAHEILLLDVVHKACLQGITLKVKAVASSCEDLE